MHNVFVKFSNYFYNNIFTCLNVIGFFAGISLFICYYTSINFAPTPDGTSALYIAIMATLLALIFAGVLTSVFTPAFISPAIISFFKFIHTDDEIIRKKILKYYYFPLFLMAVFLEFLPNLAIKPSMAALFVLFIYPLTVSSICLGLIRLTTCRLSVYKICNFVIIFIGAWFSVIIILSLFESLSHFPGNLNHFDKAISYICCLVLVLGLNITILFESKIYEGQYRVLLFVLSVIVILTLIIQHLDAGHTILYTTMKRLGIRRENVNFIINSEACRIAKSQASNSIFIDKNGNCNLINMNEYSSLGVNCLLQDSQNKYQRFTIPCNDILSMTEASL